MRNILSILGTITLIGTSTTSLVACSTPQKYTKEELEKLKEENKINTTNQQIKDNLEWITPQEKPFNEVDNKWYFVVWRGDKNNDWRIVKFKHNELKNLKIFDKYNGYVLQLREVINYWQICSFSPGSWAPHFWESENNNYIKSVYRWKLDKNIPNLVVNDKTGEVKVKEE